MRRVLYLLVGVLGVGCDSGRDEKPTDSALHATLDLDIRDELTVDLAISGDEIDAEIVLSKGFGIAPANRTLSGVGRVERFPEADITLYTARFTVKSDEDSPCADYVSLALALHQRGKEPRLSGSLTPYCGAYTYHGIPARNPLRVSSPAPGLE